MPKKIREHGWFTVGEQGYGYPKVTVNYYKPYKGAKYLRILAIYEEFSCPDFFRDLGNVKSKREAKIVARSIAAEFVRKGYEVYYWRTMKCR